MSRILKDKLPDYDARNLIIYNKKGRFLRSACRLVVFVAVVVLSHLGHRLMHVQSYKQKLTQKLYNIRCAYICVELELIMEHEIERIIVHVRDLHRRVCMREREVA